MTFRVRIHASSPERLAERTADLSSHSTWEPGTGVIAVRVESQHRALRHVSILACAVVERDLLGVRWDGVTPA